MVSLFKKLKLLTTSHKECECMKIFICEDDPKQRENMVTIIKNYIMIEEKPMEIALATDNPYEVLEQAKNMNDIGCYFFRYSTFN